MANLIVYTQDVKTGHTYTMTSNDVLIVSQTGAILWDGNSTIDFAPGTSNASVSVAGVISVKAMSIATGSLFSVAQTGTVIITASEIELGGSFGNSSFSNAGSLLSDFSGVKTLSINNSVFNSGTINTYVDGVVLGSDGGESNALVNSGEIFSFTTGVVLYGNLSKVSNTGTIASKSDVCITVNAWTPSAGGLLVESRGASQTIDNFGSISSTYSYGIYVELQLSTGTVTLHNSGVVSGVFGSFSGSPGREVINNTGEMKGDVWLQGGNDLFDTTDGRVTGIVYLGDGADVFKGIGATINGSILDSGGEDTYYTDDTNLQISESGTDIDTLYAAATYRLQDKIESLNLLEGGDYRGIGNGLGNTITGNAGDNRLIGLAGNDMLYGGVGDDRLSGDRENDTMMGGDGNDALFGGMGNDSIRGEDGDDILNGGLGIDLITGGGGVDTFVFSALSHIGGSLATADVIAEYGKGEDIINVSAIDANRNNTNSNDTFVFIGTAAFSNVAGQMRYSQAAGFTNIEMDVNGDAIIDAIIRVFGTYAMNASDFAL